VRKSCSIVSRCMHYKTHKCFHDQSWLQISKELNGATTLKKWFSFAYM
jgi:hypothetical protein